MNIRGPPAAPVYTGKSISTESDGMFIINTCMHAL